MRTCPVFPSCPVPYLGSPALVHAGWVLAAQSLLLCWALVFCGEAMGINSGWGSTHTPLGSCGLQARGLEGRTSQSCLQRKSVSFSLLKANLSAGGSVCRALFCAVPQGNCPDSRGESLEISYSFPQSHWWGEVRMSEGEAQSPPGAPDFLSNPEQGS